MNLNFFNGLNDDFIPIRNINWSYCQFERSREPLDHLDCARCDKKGLDFYICLIGII